MCPRESHALAPPLETRPQSPIAFAKVLEDLGFTVSDLAWASFEALGLSDFERFRADFPLQKMTDTLFMGFHEETSCSGPILNSGRLPVPEMGVPENRGP